MSIVISVENLSKCYQLGVINTGTFYGDLKRWWAKLRGKPDPYLKIGEKDQRNRQGETIWALKDINFQVQQAIVTITERKSRLTLIRKVERRTSQAVQEAVTSLLKPYKMFVHTLTSDNSKEFADHQEIAEKLNAGFHFAHPYAAWERGSNENMNGLLRQYFPKGRTFAAIT